MLSLNDFIVIIPARGGSKRVPNKNIKLLNKRPLISHSIEYSLKFFSKEKIWINSDSEEILNIGLDYGINCYRRKEELAKDKSKTIHVLKDQIININIDFKYVVLLQPTAPLRPNDLFEVAIDILKSNKTHSLFTVSPLEKKFGKIEKNKFKPINYNFGQRSQDLNELYYENGLLYITSKDLILNGILIDNNSHPLITKGIESIIDIDYNRDFELAELIIKYGNRRKKNW